MGVSAERATRSCSGYKGGGCCLLEAESGGGGGEGKEVELLFCLPLRSSEVRTFFSNQPKLHVTIKKMLKDLSPMYTVVS